MKLKNALDVGGRQVVNICKNKSKPKSIRDRYAHRGMKMTADRHTDRQTDRNRKAESQKKIRDRDKKRLKESEGDGKTVRERAREGE